MPRRVLVGMAGIIAIGGGARWCTKKDSTAPDRFDTHYRDDGVDDITERHHEIIDGSYAKRILNNIIKEKIFDAVKLHTAWETNSQLREELATQIMPRNEDADDERGFRGASKFQRGDIVEIIHNRVLAPFQVVDVHAISDELHVDYYDDYTDDMVADYSTKSIGYDLFRASDGFKLQSVPELSLRQYESYPIGSKALCNVGDLGNNGKEDQIIPCSVKDYSSIEPFGIMVLRNEYKVIIPTNEDEIMKSKEYYETILPVWKLQRRNNIS